MKTRLNDFSFDQIHTSTIQMLCLLLVGILEFVTMCLGDFAYQEYQLAMAQYTNLIAVFYFAVTIRKPLSRTARNLLLLGLAFCAWPLLLQLRDFIFIVNPEHPHIRFPKRTYLCEYLMMLSFAAAAEKENRIAGLKLFGWVYVAASGILAVFSLPFGRKWIPAAFLRQAIWKDMRLQLVWNSNILALIFMLGISLCLIYACLYRNRWLKVLLVGLACLELIPLSLTDSRAVCLMTCCIFGGTAFVLLYRGNFRSAAIGILAAVLAAGVVFVVSREIFSAHVDAYPKTEAAAQQLEDPSLKDQPATEKETREAEYRKSSKHLTQFGGRTKIWRHAIQKIGENPRILLAGARNPDQIIPFRSGYAAHAHNSWLESIMQLGILGFLFACLLTWLAVKNSISLIFFKKAPAYQKTVGVVMIGFLISQFFEVYLFFGRFPTNFSNMLFMLLLGYLICWDQAAPPIREQQKKLRK